MHIDFEDLIKNQAVKFPKVLDYLGIDKDLIDIERTINTYEFHPTRRPETAEDVERLRNLVDLKLESSD